MMDNDDIFSSDDDAPLIELLPLAHFGNDNNETLNLSITPAISNEQLATKSDSSCSETSEYIDDSDADPTFTPGVCHAKRCKEDVFAACERCEILLCYDHFVVDSDSCDHGKLNKKKRKGHKRQRTPGECTDFVAVGEVIQPESFEVEGVQKEIPISKSKKTNKYKAAKHKRNSGQEYLNPKTKKTYAAKKMGDKCDAESCRKAGSKCSSIAAEKREEIFKEYYGLGDLRLQREFIIRHIDRTQTKKENPASRRQNSNRYFLTVDGERTIVCQKMFLSTLGISEKTARTAVAKKSSYGTIEPEKRGGRVSKTMKARDLEIASAINKHIDRFPRVESHYCRSSSSKEYLHPGLTIPKMYRMFVEQCSEDIPSFSTYTRVFKRKNLVIHRPKKDQCSLCMTYKGGDQATQEQLSSRYESHTAEKTKVRELKETSKKEATTSDDVLAATFDLQQVIYLPVSQESALFYKRRLANYNLTFHNLADKNCHCFLWHEAQSKRGSSEIATAVYKALTHYDNLGTKNVQLYADGCPGQNKNSIMPTMMLYAVNRLTNIKDISLRYFETSHGQNEGDSVHSTISTALSRAGDIFVPSQLIPILKLARSKQPYQVVPLEHNDFLDFKKLSIDLRVLNVRRDSDTNEIINWNNVMELRVKKEVPDTIFYKNSHHSASYSSIALKRQKIRVSDTCLSRLNDQQPTIAEAKFNDLASLCQGDTPLIRLAEHKEFFLNLPH